MIRAFNFHTANRVFFKYNINLADNDDCVLQLHGIKVQAIAYTHVYTLTICMIVCIVKSQYIYIHTCILVDIYIYNYIFTMISH